MRCAISSKRSSFKGMPARPAIAMRWISALVEPESACTTAIALSNASAVKISDGRRFSHTISTMRRPVALAMRGCAESAAGIETAPGRVSPSVSTAEVIVEAVPIVMQWP
jgi:hypothetical protein